MRLLVTGGTGYLGAELVTQASVAGHHVVAVSRRSARRLDITDSERCHAVVREVAPDVVIHTAYDYRSWAVTADGAVNVALAAADAGAHLVFVSSDAIFSGADSPYDEQAHPDPVTRYGAAKAAAETAIRAVLPTATIARSSLILGPDSSMERLVHALAGGGDGMLFTDQIRCPVHRDDLAAALLELAGERLPGVFHCGGADAISRADMGRLIAKRDGLDFERIRIGSRADLGPGQQLDVRLDSRHTQELLRSRLRGAQEFLAE
ncbi:dTDP-4-dehydrorhamnose reductase [Flexivirga endophytica]|uniref:dTDP-4-dehydrorhamnose reductase n=1 Tax=Flexivirga endophytica TaxID=1849103 RepID=A0A916TCY4_9MICO|nr:sugar nucleotide-binding protein [Flexivirga endophytica]GGB40577.1 dTDP-4-dehydrorhamnose reductase [Flexivirga endophytica]GHB48390.1 dTDP-4-dehydrorhamnose reductase [Flexivirga endophytica]